MKTKTELKRILAVTALGVFAVGGTLMIAGPAQSQSAANDQKSAPVRTIPLELGRSIPLKVQSSGVEWAGQKLHLLTLNSIQFELDKQTNHLKAEIQAEGMSFENVDYDISVAVFDAAGELLGTARTQCQLQRVWKGTFKHGLKRTISLDFGSSLGYPRATTFMVSISNRKVLTPDEWQK